MSNDAIDLSKKRNFLLAVDSEEICNQLSAEISKHIKRSNFFYSKNSVDTFNKISNAPPHVVILDPTLEKVKLDQFVETFVADKECENVSLIVLGPIPDECSHVDEIVTGRIQYLDDWQSSEKMSRVLSRSFNFLSREEPKQFHLKFLAPGDMLLKEGEKGRSVYIVRSGQLEANTSKNGEKIVLGKIIEGEFVGEMAYINHEPRSANVVALQDCELIEIPIDLLDHMLFQKPSWSRSLMMTLANRVKAGNLKSK